MVSGIDMIPEVQANARAAIRHLQAIYNMSGDRGKIGELIAVFTKDGVLEVPGAQFAGRQAIFDFLSRVSDGAVEGVDLSGSRHHLTTSRIEFEDRATALGWTYFFVMRRGQVIEEGTYIDRYVKSGEDWLIAHRRVKLIFSADEAQPFNVAGAGIEQ